MKIHEYQAKKLLLGIRVVVPGGVKVVHSVDEVEVAAELAQVIGMKLVTHQVGPLGREVKHIIAQEPYITPSSATYRGYASK